MRSKLCVQIKSSNRLSISSSETTRSFYFPMGVSERFWRLLRFHHSGLISVSDRLDILNFTKNLTAISHKKVVNLNGLFF